MILLRQLTWRRCDPDTIQYDTMPYHTIQRLVFSLGMSMFVAANNTLPEDEEPSFTQPFDTMLTNMTAELQDDRPTLSHVYDVCMHDYRFDEFKLSRK